MMGIPPSEAKKLTWWEYQAMLWTWNDRHAQPEDEEVAAPDADYVARRQQWLAERMGTRVIH